PDQFAVPCRSGAILRRFVCGLWCRRSRIGRCALANRHSQRCHRPQLLTKKTPVKNKLLICFALFSLLLAASCSRKVEVPADSRVVRCAVIGGMTMTGLWQEIAKMFEAQTGYRVEVVVTGPRPILDTAMRAGKVD